VLGYLLRGFKLRKLFSIVSKGKAKWKGKVRISMVIPKEMLIWVIVIPILMARCLGTGKNYQEQVMNFMISKRML
jgi:hypothetical protein